jgi:hypothetical protein
MSRPRVEDASFYRSAASLGLSGKIFAQACR